MRPRILQNVGFVLFVLGLLVTTYGCVDPIRVTVEEENILAEEYLEARGSWIRGHDPPSDCYFSFNVDKAKFLTYIRTGYHLSISIRSNTKINVRIASEATWKKGLEDRFYVYYDVAWNDVKDTAETFDPPFFGTYYIYVFRRGGDPVSYTYFTVTEVYEVKEMKINWTVIGSGASLALLGLGTYIAGRRATVVIPEGRIKYCTHCEAPIERGVIFCANCGEKIEE